MSQYIQNITAVLATVIAKEYALEKNQHPFEPEPVYRIDLYPADLADSGLNFSTFAATLLELEQKKYVNVDAVALTNQFPQSIPEHKSHLHKILSQNLVHKPGVLFSLTIRGNIWKLHTSILQNGNLDEVNFGVTTFIADDYVLHVNGEKIKLKLKNDVPGEAYILAHMQQNGFEHEYFFSEMIKVEVWEGHNQRAYYDACKNLNTKIARQTNEKVKNFLIIKSGESGSVCVNPRYL